MSEFSGSEDDESSMLQLQESKGRGRKRRRAGADAHEDSDYRASKSFHRDSMYSFHTLYSFFNYSGRYNQPSYHFSSKDVLVKQKDISACCLVLKDIFGFDLRRVPHRTIFYIHNCLFHDENTPTWANEGAQSLVAQRNHPFELGAASNLLLVQIFVILLYTGARSNYTCDENVIKEELSQLGETLKEADFSRSIDDYVRQGYLDKRVDNDRKNLSFGPRVFTHRELSEEEKLRELDPRFDQELNLRELIALTSSPEEEEET